MKSMLETLFPLVQGQSKITGKISISKRRQHIPNPIGFDSCFDTFSPSPPVLLYPLGLICNLSTLLSPTLSHNERTRQQYLATTRGAKNKCWFCVAPIYNNKPTKIPACRWTTSHWNKMTTTTTCYHGIGVWAREECGSLIYNHV